MAQMIDSRDEKLDSAAIIAIALENTKSPYPPQVAYPAILREMTLPGTFVEQIGNTIFIMHMRDTLGVFKALNADSAQNFYQNSVVFLGMAKKEGMKTLVTEFQDENIYRMIKMIAANPPYQGMGMKAEKLSSGELRVTINLGA